MMWECLSSRYLWQSPWYSLREDRVRTPEGREFTFTLVDHPGAVCIVPVTAEGQVVLIRNYRYPVGEHCLEVPAGGLSSDASAEEAARRELEEEVGGTADALQYVGRFYASNGISNEIVHVYLATGVELGEPDRLARGGPRRNPCRPISLGDQIPWDSVEFVSRGFDTGLG